MEWESTSDFGGIKMKREDLTSEALAVFELCINDTCNIIRIFAATTKTRAKDTSEFLVLLKEDMMALRTFCDEIIEKIDNAKEKLEDSE